jgi:hypothetical protein
MGQRCGRLFEMQPQKRQNKNKTKCFSLLLRDCTLRYDYLYCFFTTASLLLFLYYWVGARGLILGSKLVERTLQAIQVTSLLLLYC